MAVFSINDSPETLQAHYRQHGYLLIGDAYDPALAVEAATQAAKGVSRYRLERGLGIQLGSVEGIGRYLAAPALDSTLEAMRIGAERIGEHLPTEDTKVEVIQMARDAQGIWHLDESRIKMGVITTLTGTSTLFIGEQAKPDTQPVIVEEYSLVAGAVAYLNSAHVWHRAVGNPDTSRVGINASIRN